MRAGTDYSKQLHLKIIFLLDHARIMRDCREWKLSAIDPHDRDTWRSGVRSAMRAASQLPGRGPTVVDMAPVPAR